VYFSIADQVPASYKLPAGFTPESSILALGTLANPRPVRDCDSGCKGLLLTPTNQIRESTAPLEPRAKRYRLDRLV
jgi:hypothetical protein